MTVEQIRAILLAIADQQAKVQRIEVPPTNDVLAVYFANGSIDFYDLVGKPVFPT